MEQALDTANLRVSVLNRDDDWQEFDRALSAARAVPELTHLKEWKQIRDNKLALYLKIFAKIHAAIDPKWNSAMIPNQVFLDPGTGKPFMRGMRLPPETKPEILEQQCQADIRFEQEMGAYVRQSRLREFRRQAEEQLQTYVARLFDVRENADIDREIDRVIPDERLSGALKTVIHRR